MKHIIFTIAALLCGSAASAQQLHGALHVEGAYTPDSTLRAPLEVTPQLAPKTIETMPLQASLTAVAVTPTPDLHLLPAMTATPGPVYPAGVFRLGAGSYLRNTLLAAGAFRLSPTVTAAAALHHDMDGWTYQAPGLPHKRRITSEQVAFTARWTPASHPVTLTTTLAYKLQYLNYFNTVKDYSQTYNSLRLNSLLTMKRDAALSLEVQHIMPRFIYPTAEPRHSETNAVLSYTSLLDSHFRLSAKGEVHAYKKFEGDWLPHRPIPYEATTNGLLTLTPQYVLGSGHMNLQAGADVYVTFNAHSKSHRYGPVHFAPAVSVSYSELPYAVALKVGGGMKPHTLASALGVTPYAAPYAVLTLPQYTPLDATLSARFSPSYLLTISPSVSYAITNNVLPIGWYPAYLDKSVLPAPVLTQMRMQGFSAALALTSAPAAWVSLDASLRYTPGNYYAAPDRPRWLLDASARFTPMSGLGITLDYAYRGVRRPLTATPGHAVRLPDVTDLTLRADYRLPLRRLPLTVWAEGRGLIGSPVVDICGLPLERRTLAAGLTLTL